MLINRDTYERLGLSGHKSKHFDTKYIVELDILTLQEWQLERLRTLPKFKFLVSALRPVESFVSQCGGTAFIHEPELVREAFKAVLPDIMRISDMIAIGVHSSLHHLVEHISHQLVTRYVILDMSN